MGPHTESRRSRPGPGLGGDGPPGRELLRVPWLGSARDLQRLRRAAGLRPLRGDTGRTPFLEVLGFAIVLGSVLGASWGRPGPSWGHFGAVLGALGAVLGRLEHYDG